LYSFVGRLFVKALGKPSDILTTLTEMAGFSANEEIDLYEVSATFSFL
jgi:ubiquitin carboxyl-terminal hydrolase 7